MATTTLAGTWLCPLCETQIRITFDADVVPGGLVFKPTDAPWADVELHLAAEHPEVYP